MKRLISIILLLIVLGLSGCSFISYLEEYNSSVENATTEDKTVYYSINDLIENKEDNVSYSITNIVIYGVSYKGTKDLRSIEIDVNVQNNNTDKKISFYSSTHQWVLYAGDYKYICEEAYGTMDFVPGGKGVFRSFFSVPDSIYQQFDDFLFVLNRKSSGFLETISYEIKWKISVDHNADIE